MADVGSLRRLALATIWCAPELCERIATNCVAGDPELRCNSCIDRVFVEAAKFAIMNLACYFSAELKIHTLVVNAP